MTASGDPVLGSVTALVYPTLRRHQVTLSLRDSELVELCYSRNKRKEGGTCMDFTLRGKALSITRADILRDTRDVLPTPRDGRHKYFIKLHGQRFPIKQVLRLVTHFPAVDFTAQDAYRILSRLGFDIFEDHVPAPANAGTPARSNDDPASLIDHVATNQDNGEVLRLLVVFQVDEDGWEVASCPSLPGCHSQGRTREEALDNVREAIKGYLASLREHDATLPPSSEFQIVEIRA